MIICKECNQEYIDNQYFNHLHGKNHPRYKNGNRVKRKLEYKICKECDEKYYNGEGWEHRHGKNGPRYGSINSKEIRQKISIGNKGKIVSQESRRKMSIAKSGKTFSKLHCKKIGVASKRNWRDGVYDYNPIGSSRKGYRKDIGHFVRSTWEANFARILNYSGVDYEYEPKRFNLGYTTYTPDFKIGNKYVEIKGYDTKEAKKKRIMCRKIYEIKILIIKKIKYLKLQNKYMPLIKGWEL